MSSTSALRFRQQPGHLMASVATGIAAEIVADPDAVPETVLCKAKGWSAPSAAGIHIMGHETRRAGWRHGRLPGLRDMVGEFHPVFDRMMVMARRYEKNVPPERETALRSPARISDLWQAAIYRWSNWFGVDADLCRVYRDDNGKLADDPAYAGHSYDADHAPDELLRQVVDVTLIDWIGLLEALRVTWPAMFDAVWHRDAKAVDRLSRQNWRLPDMPFLRVRKGSADKLRTVVAIFWEAERMFEFMHAIGGPRRVTMTKLLSALASTSMLGGAVEADDPTGRYIGSMWCHRGALALLFDEGLATGTDARHPHRSLGPGGDVGATDEIEGCVSDAGLDLAGFNARTAPPFALDSRLRDVLGEESVAFFAGRDVRSLAIRFLLEVRESVGQSKGRKKVLGPPLFEIETHSAIGRLALLTIARICPDTARSIMREAFDAKIAKTGGTHPNVAPTLGDVVANPRRWRALYGVTAPANSVAARSEWLGKDILGGMVDKSREDASRFVSPDPVTLGHTICFVPDAWFEPYREMAMLQVAWENVGRDHETAFPGCFDRSIPADELAFCVRVAARQQVAATDMLRDPHCRQPDSVRSPNRGRAGTGSPAPPPLPPTASQRLLLGRLRLAGMGGPVNPKATKR
jgi:hypothetical protein